jgi:hypothetical protein
MQSARSVRGVFVVCLVAGAIVLGGAAEGVRGLCGPFTDVSDAAFCPFVLELFYLAVTTGTTPTTFDPNASVTRLQMAAFLSRTVDRSLRRAGRRAVLNQHWTIQAPINLGVTTLPSVPRGVQSDGTDVWVALQGSDQVSRVRGGDGRVVETWSGASGALSVLVAMGRVFATGSQSSGQLYRIDPSLPAGAVTTVATGLGNSAQGIGFDGSRIWTGGFHSISIVTPTASLPWTVTTISTGFNYPIAPLWDGSNIWVTDFSASALLKVDFFGSVLQTVTVGLSPGYSLFDGTNIFAVSGADSSVTVIHPQTGAVLATLTGNGLSGPSGAAFDGERLLVTNYSGNSVSLWKASDLTPIGTFQVGAARSPFAACSDGINFWITMGNASLLARY